MDIHQFSFLADGEAKCHVLALGEDGENVLLLQRSYEFDEQDEAQGMDTYCLVTPDGATHYGGVEHYALNASQLILHLDHEAADTLDTVGFDLTLHLPAEALPALAAALAVIFDLPQSSSQFKGNHSPERLIS